MVKKVLLDLSVRRNAVTHRTVLEKKKIKWGDISREYDLAIRKHFHPRDNEMFRREQIPYVAVLPELVSVGRIELFRSFELVMEDMRNVRRDRGYLGLDLLEGMQIGSVRPPVERNIMFAGHGNSHGITKEEQIAFFKSITDARFHEIRRVVGDAHIGDAFHFWTAEHAALDVYLTMDQRFARVFRKQAEKKINSRVKVMTPKELCQDFNAGPKDIERIALENLPFS